MLNDDLASWENDDDMDDGYYDWDDEWDDDDDEWDDDDWDDSDEDLPFDEE